MPVPYPIIGNHRFHSLSHCLPFVTRSHELHRFGQQPFVYVDGVAHGQPVFLEGWFIHIIVPKNNSISILRHVVLQSAIRQGEQVPSAEGYAVLAVLS
jgi:hypothetical protein